MVKGGEFVPANVSAKDVREEADKRASKLGYCTKYGEPPYATKIMATVPFGERKLNIWPRDPITGKLLDDD